MTSHDKTKAGTNHFVDSNEMVNDRRLNIAAMMVGYLIQGGYYALGERYRKENMSEIIKLSLQFADALIAETKKISNSN